MSEKEHKSLSDGAGEVADLVRDPNNWLIFRGYDQTWFDEYKKQEQKWKRYIEKCRKLQENMIFKDPKYQALLDEEGKLSQRKNAIEKKLSEKEKNGTIGLEKDLAVVLEGLKAVLKKSSERRAYLEKPYEHAKAKIEKPTGTDLRGLLSLPEFYPTYESANFADLFGWVDERPSFDKYLGPLVRYVRLTILHDKILSSSTIERISKGIWPKDESFAEVFWEELQAGWEHSEKIRGIINEDIQNVKYELNNQAGLPNNMAAGEKEADKPISTSTAGTDPGKKPEETEQEVGNGKTNDEVELTWQGKAIALALDHRDWSVKKIANEVGISRQNLYKDPLVADALKARNQQKRPDKSHYHKGEKNSETGDLQAW